ncbi:unnamed protein product [Rhizoctonia solani]|uniref:AB hydrolase-1 domain-containing protein n=1 Tax=Rhizoctonia solani TaxID=456999 RepID=A0A8H3B1A3_9AGAM|nr:unnamed protein product [Rhizoctonia solani]
MILTAIAKRNAEKRAQASGAQLGPMPENPIVLCHGLFGFDTLFGFVNYWKEVPEALEAAGAEVFVARVPATSATETRAAELRKQIDKKYPGRSVHLIGHSMGGLDCRCLVTHMMKGAKFKVLSVSTIATPHRGSAAADVLMSTPITKLPHFQSFLNLFPVGDGDGQAFASLSSDNTRTFNATTPDVEGVRYLSWGCSFVPGILDSVFWGAPFAAVQLKDGSNDGVVSVASAKWGEYLGTIEGVNHTEIIGHKVTHTRPTDILNLVGGNVFDHKQFYLKHARLLASDVEKQG